MREIHEKGSRGTNKKDHFTDILVKLYLPTVPQIRNHMPPMRKQKKSVQRTSDDVIFESLLDPQGLSFDY